MAFAPAGLMMIGTRGEGVLMSRDQGQTWTPLAGAPSSANIQSLAVGSDGTIYTGVYESGLFVSRNEGKTWTPRSFAYLSHVKQVAADDNGIWYVGCKRDRVIEKL
jgi:lipid-binding SYLF domain-containing protein